MADINPLERYFIEKMSEANYGLWNALLTVNGIMTATFSLLIALSTCQFHSRMLLDSELFYIFASDSLELLGNEVALLGCRSLYKQQSV